MTLTLMIVVISWVGWRYWPRYERLRQRERDQAYWEKVRRDCPSCAMRREEKEKSRHILEANC